LVKGGQEGFVRRNGMVMKVAFIGLGIMGQPMAKNVVSKGYPLSVYNRTAEKMLPLKEAGAVPTASPKEAAEGADVVILMLTGPEAVDQVLDGTRGVLAGLDEGKTIINMSTVPPAYSGRLSERLKSHSIVAVDAPVYGSKKAAEEGALVILAGGPQSKVKEVEPLLLSMGKKVVYCGEAGQGSSMKMVANLLLGIMAAGLAEAVNLGQRCGLSTEVILETILSGPTQCPLFEFKKPMLINDDYGAQFPLKHMAKDVRFILQTADEAGAAAPVGHVVFQLYRGAVGRGLSDQDFAAVKKILESMSDPHSAP
jgi:3-hydroxyisobutyrate dehydrogenase-like beta-hydroxyacid dehydrogenase